MPHPSIERPASALRLRMLEDITMRGLREATQRDYIRFVRAFAAFLERSPDTASVEDVRRFQVHQAETGVQAPTINELQKANPDVTQHMLTTQLRELVRNGLVIRTVYPEIPPRVEYRLSDDAKRLESVF